MIEIISYQKKYGPYFESINKAWIAKYFKLEPIDKKVLEQHQEYILDKGGYIFFAIEKDQVVGTVALKKESHDLFELAKMGVIPEAQGKGVGSMLVKYCLQFAKEMGISTLFLDSSRKLDNALHIYRKMGFKEIPVPCSEYERCDIRMELRICEV